MATEFEPLVDAAQAMKTRLLADLRAALKERRACEARVVRTLIAAIDNAEAPPADAGPGPMAWHEFRSGAAEVERLFLSCADVRRTLQAEVDERESAAAELERLGRAGEATALRSEADLARRYLA